MVAQPRQRYSANSGGKSVLEDAAVYADKVLGGWLGKNIGGTLGMPFEGVMDVNELSYYDPYPRGAVPNDDLDLQVLWLYAMRGPGRNITSHDLRRAWISHLTNPCPDEYGKCDINMRRGLVPPICGWYNNYFIDCMGAPIRSEIWAMICPGYPGVAVQYAYNDATLDHTGEGVNGEVFLAALESAAFVTGDLASLIETGLSYIPAASDVAKAIRYVVEARQDGADWRSARAGLLARFPTVNFTTAPINIGFIAIGLLYGRTFDECLTTAVNCGYDTDCTGATVGAILGIIHGAKAIPEKWLRPIGHELVHAANLFPSSRPFKDLHELTAATVKLGLELLQEPCPERRAVERHEFVKKLEHTHPSLFSVRIPGGEVSLDYGGFPTLGRDVEKVLTYTFSAASGSAGEYDVVPLHDEGLSSAGVRTPGRDAATLSYTVKVRARCNFWPPYHALRLQLMHKHGAVHELPVALISRKLWEVSRTVGRTDPSAFEAMDPFSIPDGSFLAIEAEDESLNCLFGAVGSGIVIARRKVHFPQSVEIRVICECSDWVSVWHEGAQIIDCRRRDGVIPSPHRSRVTGARTRVNRGWNTFTLRALKSGPDYAGFFFFADPETLMSFVDLG
jgi:hypothetical protein